MEMRAETLISVAAAFVLVFVSAATAQRGPIVRKALQRGDVRVVAKGSWTTWRGRVTITRRDRLVTQRRFRGAIPESLSVRDLDGDQEPEVIVTLNIGGAHGRSYSLFFTYDPSAGRYRELAHWWHEVPAEIGDLNGDDATEFITADTRFAYEFTSFADSYFSVQVWTYRAGSLRNTTRGYATLIREDAARLWRWYLLERKQRRPEVRGILAAYQADKYLLGEQNDGWRRLEAAYRRGDVGGDPKGRGPSPTGWPSGKRYLWKLRHFLQRTGYAPD
jgi:hypothetical protein